MRLFLIIILLSSCKANISRTISLNEVGWTFELPSDISFKDSAFSSSGQINHSSWETSSVTPDKNLLTLFWIESDENNFFNSVLFIDSSDNSTWERRNREESKLYLRSLFNLTSYNVIDSSLSIEKIDHVSFQREYFKVYNKINNKTFYSYKFSRKYGHYKVYINIRFTDISIGNKYLGVLRKSKFKE